MKGLRHNLAETLNSFCLCVVEKVELGIRIYENILIYNMHKYIFHSFMFSYNFIIYGYETELRPND